MKKYKVEAKRGEMAEGPGIGIDVKDESGAVVGQMEVYEKPDYLYVGHSQVDPELRKAGIGTTMYEAALRTACEVGKPLGSDSMRSHFAEAFWRKQETKGRATCVGKKGKVYNLPLREVTRFQRTKDVEALKATLPMPQGDFWPCARYEVRTPCTTKSLAGVDGLARLNGYLNEEKTRKYKEFKVFSKPTFDDDDQVDGRIIVLKKEKVLVPGAPARDVAVGHLTLRDQKDHVKVTDVKVDMTMRGQRLGTEMYREALKYARLRKLPLSSDDVRSAFSEAFWQKQIAKGRANCVKEDLPGTVWHSMLRDSEKKWVDTTKLPVPAKAPEGYDVWPCTRIQINSFKVKDLSGVTTEKASLLFLGAPIGVLVGLFFWAKFS